ncbi:unnamed protein product [Rotaria socialis]
MEKLPNELWQISFSYLHGIEILYSFHNLNIRFEQLIKPYVSNVDLSDISYKSFKQINDQIFPQYTNQIRSLTLKNRFQLYLFNEFCEQQFSPTKILQNTRSYRHNRNIKKQEQRTLSNKIKSCFQLPKNLRRLTLIDDRHREIIHDCCSCGFDDESPTPIDFNFEQIPPEFCTHLKELHVFAYFDLNRTLEQIASHSQLPVSLTHLTLIRANGGGIQTTTNMIMPNIKSLTIQLSGLQAVFPFFRIMTNLNELNVSILTNNDLFSTFLNDADDSTNEDVNFQIPSSLTKLHLESVRSSRDRFSPKYQEIKKFLFLFKHQLQSLSLIVFNSRDKEFANLNGFQNNFSHLKSFQYYIHTNQCPTDFNQCVKKLPNGAYELYTPKHRPSSFTLNNRRRMQHRGDIREMCYDNLTALTLDDNTTLKKVQIAPKLRNLIEINYLITADWKLDGYDPECLHKVLSLSPNMKMFNIDGETSQQVISVLKVLPISSLKNFTHLLVRFEETAFDSRFLIELARIISSKNNLKYLYIHCFGSKYSQNSTNPFLSTTMMDHVEKYFHNLIHLDLSISRKSIRQEQAYNRFKVWLHQHNNQFMTLVTLNDSKTETKLTLWR